MQLSRDLGAVQKICPLVRSCLGARFQLAKLVGPGPRKVGSSCMAVATGGLATWSSSLHGVVASMAGKMGLMTCWATGGRPAEHVA